MDARNQIINFLLGQCDEKDNLIKSLNQRVTDLTKVAEVAVAPPTDA